MAQEIAMLTIQIGVIIFASRFCGRLAEKIKIPSVLGELLCGIIIGPYMLGQIGFLEGTHFVHGIFPHPEAGAAIPVSDSLYSIATI